MNADRLKRDIGKHFRIRPLPERWDNTVQLESMDDRWSLDDVNSQHIKITNLSTGHSKELGHDNVREYRSPDFLLLHCQLILRGNAVETEPILFPRTILTEEQERLLRIIAEHQRKFGVPKLRISRDGAYLIRPDKGIWVQVREANIGLELFGSQKLEAHRLREFEPIMDAMPEEYLRRIPESVYGDPFVVAVTPEGFKYLGMPPRTC